MKTIEQAATEYAAQERIREHAAFIAGVAFAQRWIPVEEELPPINELVLVVVKEEFKGFEEEYISMDKIDKDGNWVYCYLPYPDMPKVTHWRPVEIKL